MSGKVPLPSSLPPPLAPLPNTPPRSLCRSLLSWCSLSRVWYCRKSRFFCSWRSLVVSISCFSSALSRWLSMRILAVCSCRHSDACYVRGRGKKERHDQETGRGNRKRKIFKRQRYTHSYKHIGSLCLLPLSWPSPVQPSQHHMPSSLEGTVSSFSAHSPHDGTSHLPTASLE